MSKTRLFATSTVAPLFLGLAQIMASFGSSSVEPDFKTDYQFQSGASLLETTPVSFLQKQATKQKQNTTTKAGTGDQSAKTSLPRIVFPPGFDSLMKSYISAYNRNDYHVDPKMLNEMKFLLEGRLMLLPGGKERLDPLTGSSVTLGEITLEGGKVEKYARFDTPSFDQAKKTLKLNEKINNDNYELYKKRFNYLQGLRHINFINQYQDIIELAREKRAISAAFNRNWYKHNQLVYFRSEPARTNLLEIAEEQMKQSKEALLSTYNLLLQENQLLDMENRAAQSTSSQGNPNKATNGKKNSNNKKNGKKQ